MTHPDRLALRYIRKTGICCVFIAAPYTRHSPVKVDWDRETLGPSATKKVTFWRRVWCANQRSAEDLVAAFERSAGALRYNPVGKWFDMSVEEADRALRRCAAERGVALTENSVVVERAKLVAAEISAIMDDKNRRGEMKDINKAYKAYRQAQNAAGKRAIDYNDFVGARLDPVLDAVVLRIFGVRAA